MKIQSFDVVVSGGGIAGLSAAAGFAHAGFSVQCLDPVAPVTSGDAAGSDLRSTAFLQPAQSFLEEIGLWTSLAQHATPLQTMRIVDAGRASAEALVVKEFDASEISQLPFGWNLPNWLLRREILKHLKTLPNVTLKLGIGSKELLTRTDQAQVVLSDGSISQCRLLVAADGRNSTMRQAAGISVKTLRYGQKALALAVNHEQPHHNVSTEIHRSGGPFTLVPLPDHQSRPCSALVWMERGAEIQRLAQLDDTSFEAAMTERSGGFFGPLTLASRRSVWPIISQIAERMYGERVALIAEAAHVVPPIGAQGLNMSLNDLKALLDLARARPEGLGDQAMLATYHKSRHSEIQLRVRGIDVLNRASMAEVPLLKNARALGLHALYALPPVRKMLMQMGLGAR